MDAIVANAGKDNTLYTKINLHTHALLETAAESGGRVHAVEVGGGRLGAEEGLPVAAVVVGHRLTVVVLGEPVRAVGQFGRPGSALLLLPRMTSRGSFVLNFGMIDEIIHKILP